MSKARIVKRTGPDGRVQYVIQQKHYLFRWWWVDAWINSTAGANCRDYFDSEQDARDHLCYFDGTPTTDRVLRPTSEGDGDE